MKMAKAVEYNNFKPVSFFIVERRVCHSQLNHIFPLANQLSQSKDLLAFFDMQQNMAKKAIAGFTIKNFP